MAGTVNAIDQNTNQFLKLAGGTMSGAINMGSQLITSLATPSASTDAATKGYVDNVVLNTLTACVCASTAALTATYANGSSGVGATLTNAGAMAAFSVDGISPTTSDRVLIKNQASGLENGIYTVTTVGSGAVNWVLTRATDYDQASEMQAGDKVAVVQGTTQAATEWMMTQTAAITVGTTAITWAEMGQVTSSITSVVQQIFTANGTYTPTAGMIYCIAEVVGGGGSGAGAEGVAGQSAAGGGGAGGGYSKGIFTASQIKEGGTAASVTIGAGGTAPAAGNNNGNAGGTTTIVANSGGGATLIQATGGAGGNLVSSTAGVGQGNDSLGGIGSSGSLNVRGGSGRTGIVLSGVGGVFTAGSGGNSVYGGGAPGFGNNLVGTTGGVYGGAGSGGSSSSASGAVSGGAGAAGVVYITEFVSTSA